MGRSLIDVAEVRRRLVGVLTPASQPGRFGHDRESLVDEIARTTGLGRDEIASTLADLVAEGLVVEKVSGGGYDYVRLAQAEQQSLF